MAQYDPGLASSRSTSTSATVSHDLCARFEASGEVHVPACSYAVLEIKANDRVPYWLTHLVGRHNLQLTRMSKYCSSLDTAGYGQREHRFRSVLVAG